MRTTQFDEERVRAGYFEGMLALNCFMERRGEGVREVLLADEKIGTFSGSPWTLQKILLISADAPACYV